MSQMPLDEKQLQELLELARVAGYRKKGEETAKMIELPLE